MEYDRMKAGVENDSAPAEEGFYVGQIVQIKSGVFNGFRGTIEEVEQSKSTVSVAVTVFQRNTKVSLSLSDVEKVDL